MPKASKQTASEVSDYGPAEDRTEYMERHLHLQLHHDQRVQRPRPDPQGTAERRLPMPALGLHAVRHDDRRVRRQG